MGRIIATRQCPALWVGHNRSQSVFDERQSIVPLSSISWVEWPFWRKVILLLAGETHCLLLIVFGFFWVSLCIEN